MKLKTKLARTLRNWAEKLEPLFPYNLNFAPPLKSTTADIQRVMVKHSVARYAYEQYPERFDQLIWGDIIAKIAKELSDNKLVKIKIDPTPYEVNYIGELNVICHREELL